MLDGLPSMELREKVAQLPLAPGVYLYKDAGGRVIYVGKAKILRHRVRSYFSEDKLADVKTGTLISEARDIDYILVDNEKEALALENNLIKQYKPRFNILLRDDKTYPYIKLTHEKYPRVYVTRRLRKDGATYFGPYFPGQPGAPAGALHSPPFSGAVLQGGSDALPSQAVPAISHSPLPGAVRGRADHGRSLRRARCATCACFWKAGTATWRASCAQRMEAASEEMRFEEAAALRDLLTTVEEIEERQKMAAAKGDDVDIFACYAEPPLVALNLFHLRNGQIVDRREFFWEDQPDFDEPQFFSSLLQADLSRPAVHSRPRSMCRWISKTARRWKNCSRKSATAKWRSARRSAGRRRPCWTWWRPTPSTASTPASAC